MGHHAVSLFSLYRQFRQLEKVSHDRAPGSDSVRGPASGSPAGQDQAVGNDRQAHLIRLDMSAAQRINGGVQQVVQDRRLQAGGIGVEQDEQGIVREQLHAFLQEGIDAGRKGDP